ncbi:MAG: diphthamide biosynthesis enzyme Dph2 [Candidatus Woesearchaeota archaeon]
MYEKWLKEELEKLKKEIKKEDSPIAIQLPEGLKQFTTLVLDELAEYEPIIFVDPMFGACDLKDDDALKFGCKLLVHFGHAAMGKQRIKTIFVPVTYRFNTEELTFIIEEIENLGDKKINLTTTINYLDEMPKIKKALSDKNIEVLESQSTTHIQKNHILGCDSSTIVDKNYTIVYVGDGDFHPNNLGFVFEKTKVYVVNPIIREVKLLEINDLFVKQRYALVAKAMRCNTFGIFVSSKHGQFRLRFAKYIKKKLENMGKKAYLFGCNYVNEDYVEGIKVDCYVNTACPRIAYDDHANFNKPIITPQEVFLLEDINKELKIDQIRELEDYFN